MSVLNKLKSRSYLISWSFAVLLIMGGLGALSDSILASFIAFLTALYLIPKVRGRIFDYLNVEEPQYSVLIAGFAGFMVFGALVPSTPSTTESPAQNENDAPKNLERSADVSILSNSISTNSTRPPAEVLGQFQVRNSGNKWAFYTFEMEIDGVLQEFRDVNITSGATERVNLTSQVELTGEHQVTLFAYDVSGKGEVEPVNTETISLSR